MERPNVVMIVMDQERRWEDLPAGFPAERELPNRARLRSQSVQFERMTINTNPCTPSRGVLYTGLGALAHS